MSDDNADATHIHHGLRERLDAAEAAADEVVAEESGQLGGEVNALAVPFEEIAAAVRAAIHPGHLAEHEVTAATEGETAEGPDSGGEGDPPARADEAEPPA